LKCAYRIGLGSGDFQIAVLNASIYLWNSFGSIPITETYNYMQSLVDHEKSLAPLKSLFQLCKYFLGHSIEKPKNIHKFIKDGSGLEEVPIEEYDLFSGCIDYYSMITAYHFSNFELAERLSHNAARFYRGVGGMVSVHGRMYDALSNIAVASRGNLRRIWQIRHHLKIMRRWSKNCPENFLGNQLLVEAELASFLNDRSEAKAKYYTAIIQFRDAGILMLEALANELAGKFYIKIGNPYKAIPMLEEARRLYRAWGGTTKLRHLEQEIGYLFVN